MLRFWITIFAVPVLLGLSNVEAHTGLTCHDCTGNSECDTLLQNQWTGKCRTQYPGKCFIREDPNGILYRGCADELNWPHLDYSYNGCRYQTYGWWSKKPVIWCFCDFDLCNFNISYILYRFADTSSIDVTQYKSGSQGQSQSGQDQSQHDQMGNGQYYVQDQSNQNVPSMNPKNAGSHSQPGQIPVYYWVSKMQSGFDANYANGNSKNGGRASGSGYGDVGKELLSASGGGKTDESSNWNDVQGWIGGSNLQPQLPPLVVTKPKGKPPRLPPRVVFPPVQPWPEYWTTVIPPLYPLNPPTGPVLINPTTAPVLGVVTTTTRLPSNFTLPTTIPPQNIVTQHGPLYDIPYDLYQYLLRNLPRNSNDVHSLPYPVYVLLFLLRQSGVDLNTIPNLNITGLNISDLPPPLGDIPPMGNYSLGCVVAGCEQYCEFVLGQAQCRCRPGFTLNSNFQTCTDVNECSANPSVCTQLCVNTLGSYYCDCNRNYQLLPDQKTCQDINECSVRNGGCSDTCINLPGSHSCSCPQGFTLGLDNRTCSNSMGQCSGTQRCTQICQAPNGNPVCSCFQGYVLNQDGFTCTDLNECTDMTSQCNQTCTNTPGAYICSCRTGYRLASNLRDCLDQNECLQNNGGCKQTCTNTVGSYYCSCDTGFALGPDQVTCQDINECLTSNGGCSQNCTNLPGSFFCSCKSNLYQLQPDQKTCTGACPADFIKNNDIGSCYKIFTSIQLADALPVSAARDQCKSLHTLANLVSVETIQEKNYLAQLLKSEPVMLEGWQGWWTSGAYRAGINQFYWGTGGVIPNSGDFWGFQRPPFVSTCVWILQIPNYNYTLGNYDCYTASGYICEITYQDLLNDP